MQIYLLFFQMHADSVVLLLINLNGFEYAAAPIGKSQSAISMAQLLQKYAEMTDANGDNEGDGSGGNSSSSGSGNNDDGINSKDVIDNGNGDTESSGNKDDGSKPKDAIDNGNGESTNGKRRSGINDDEDSNPK